MSLAARHAELLANRVRKRFRHLHRTFSRADVGLFRVYDWDIPEVRATVDWVEPAQDAAARGVAAPADPARAHLVVAEYTRTQTAEEPDYLERLGAAAAEALGVPLSQVHLRERRTRPAEGERYAPLAAPRVALPGVAARAARFPVAEQGLRFWVNLDERLDVGLFADARAGRARVREEAKGRRLLNLFAYTGAFTCYAAAGGALASTSVDASATYLDIATANLALNRLAGPAHRMIRADVGDFLAHARERWDLCVLDPPSFSDREGGLDVDRDHPALIAAAMAVMAPGGVLWFSTNHQRFHPRFGALAAEDWTERLRPPDYRDTPHRVWRIVV